MLYKLAKMINKHPFVSFVVLAYVFSWWLWPLYLGGISPAVIVGFGPFLAAVLVLGFTGGRPAIKQLLSQMVHWRIPFQWYVIVLGTPILITGLASILNVLLGAPIPDANQLAHWPSLLPTFIMLLFIPGIGGAWEEPGWRGYALPKLAAGHSQLVTALILGIIWAAWHLPLFLMGIIPWADLLFIAGSTLLFNWVYSHADRSVLIIMIFHAMNNAVGQFFPSLFADAYLAQLAFLQGAICLIFGLLVLGWQWRFWIASSGSSAAIAPQIIGK